MQIMTIKNVIISLLLISTTTFAAPKIQNADIKANAAIDATKLIDGSVTNTELGYINGLTSDAQTQLGNKLDSSSFTDAAVTSKLITGYVSGAGVVAATDTILQAINKLNGNIAAIVPGTGDVVGPASAVNNNVCFFDGVSGKLIKDSGLTLSGSNTGDQTITLTGDVTGSGTGSFAATIANLSVTNAKIANSTIDLTAKVTGVLPVANGGTGQSTYTDGQVLIGNSTGNTLTKTTLTAGANITITNGGGSITIASTGGGGGFTPEVAAAQHGDDCLFSTSSGSYASFGVDATCTFSAGVSSGLTVTAYLSGGDDLPGITFSPSASGNIYEICATPTLNAGVGDSALEMYDSTGAAGLSTTSFRAGVGTYGVIAGICALYQSTGTSSNNFEIRGKTNSGSVAIGSQQTSAASIEWIVKRIK